MAGSVFLSVTAGPIAAVAGVVSPDALADASRGAGEKLKAKADAVLSDPDRAAYQYALNASNPISGVTSSAASAKGEVEDLATEIQHGEDRFEKEGTGSLYYSAGRAAVPAYGVVSLVAGLVFGLRGTGGSKGTPAKSPPSGEPPTPPPAAPGGGGPGGPGGGGGGGGKPGYISGPVRVLKEKAKGAKAGDVHAKGEIEVAKHLRSEGENVHFQFPSDKARSAAGDTADFLVGGERGTGIGGTPVEVSTPVTPSANQVLSAAASKAKQSPNVVINMNYTTATEASLGTNPIGRANGMAKSWPGFTERIERLGIFRNGSLKWW